MKSYCPICHSEVEGYGIDKRQASFVRTVYKTYGTLITPIPFVGSYIYGKLYDTISNNENQYNRFLCWGCRCSWIANMTSPDVKVGGDNILTLFFMNDSILIGSIKNNTFMTIRKLGTSEERVSVYSPGSSGLSQAIYENGQSSTGLKSFGKMKIDNFMYIGEVESSVPSGWGVAFHKNGDIWYGKWKNGRKNGVGYGCDFEGKKSVQGYWTNGELSYEL